MPDVSTLTPEDVRTEYSALTAHARQVVAVRFSLFGGFLAGCGLIVGGANPSAAKFGFLVALSIILWLLDLRNRALLNALDERAMEIENTRWGYGTSQEQQLHEEQPLVSRLKAPARTRIMWWQLSLPVSHTVAFDLAYGLACLYGVLALVLPNLF